MTTDPDVLLSAIRGAIGTLGIDASRGLTRQETADLFSAFDRLDSHMMNGGTAPRDWRGAVAIPIPKFTPDPVPAEQSSGSLNYHHQPWRRGDDYEEERWHTT